MKSEELIHLIARGADIVDGRRAFDPAIRSKYMNASEAGTCIRQQWYRKNAPELAEGEEKWGYARRGRKAEEYLVEVLKMHQ